MKTCRFCSTELHHKFADLKTSPPSNAYLKSPADFDSEKYFPLVLYVCEKCHLVQIDEEEKATNIFNEDYAYFSSFSTSWLEHCKNYTNHVIDFLDLNQSNQVVEIASNDGYLLQYFKEKGFSVLGVEPTKSTAEVAISKGIPTDIRFFGIDYAAELSSQKKADLIIANNVIAHVPEINDFVGGIKVLLANDGTATIEFPHLMRLIEENQFDTIYHEHFSYFSLLTIRKIFNHHKMEVYHVEELPTHGGSLRIYVCHETYKNADDSVTTLIDQEVEKEMDQVAHYAKFQDKIEAVKAGVLDFFETNKDKRIVAYGAAAKGNTLLNYCGIKADQIEFVVDRNHYKQGKFMPGSHIPIVDEQILKQSKADYVIFLPWNLTKELTQQLNYVKGWGGKFVSFIPELKIF